MPSFRITSTYSCKRAGWDINGRQIPSFRLDNCATRQHAENVAIAIVSHGSAEIIVPDDTGGSMAIVRDDIGAHEYHVYAVDITGDDCFISSGPEGDPSSAEDEQYLPWCDPDLELMASGIIVH